MCQYGIRIRKLDLTLPDSQDIIYRHIRRDSFSVEEELTQDLPNCHPLLPRDWLAVFVVQVDTIKQLAIDIELEMECSSVANPNWSATSISR